MSWQYGELWPTNGWDLLASLGHPYKFQRVLRLGSVTARHLVVGVSQTLWRWTEGATCVRQGDHQVGHWPTFYFFVLSFFLIFLLFVRFWQYTLIYHIISLSLYICTSSPRPKWKDLIPTTIIILSNETYHRHFANKPFEVINGLDTPLDRGRFVVVHLYSALSVRC